MLDILIEYATYAVVIFIVLAVVFYIIGGLIHQYQWNHSKCKMLIEQIERKQKERDADPDGLTILQRWKVEIDREMIQSSED